jgi:predicted metal-dependent enzyme (double-stranded beta helix superfamily)
MPWLNKLAQQCRGCINGGGGATDIRELVRQSLSELVEVPEQQEIDRIVYRSSDLLVVSLAQPSFGNTPIHSHGIWCVIGVAKGQEDNAFYTRASDGLRQISRITLRAGDSIALEPDVIHKIRNPHGNKSQVIHIYGGDLLSASRSMWNPHTGEESPLDQTQFEVWCEELTASASNSTGAASVW